MTVRLQDMSATITISLISLFGAKDQRIASKVARFGDQLCKLFQVLLVFVVKAILDSAIDIDNGDNLGRKRLQSASTLHKSTSHFLPCSPYTHSRSDRRDNKKLTFPSCKIGTTISEALAASQAM
jgi:hypothetical protein